MPNPQISLYDTRFFVEHFYSNDDKILSRTRHELDSTGSQKVVSVITLHEFYRLNLEKQGREVSLLRTKLIMDSFRTNDINSDISIRGAEMRKKYQISMGDSLIAATTETLHAVCVTDDPHIRSIKEIKTRWIV